MNDMQDFHGIFIYLKKDKVIALGHASITRFQIIALSSGIREGTQFKAPHLEPSNKGGSGVEVVSSYKVTDFLQICQSAR